MKILLALVFMPLLLTFQSHGDPPNLLPNGDAENEFLNLLKETAGYTTSIKAKDTLIPTYWRLTDGATICKDTKYEGDSAIRLQGGDAQASATIFSDYWRVKDASMPFGLPLVPNREVRLSFYYKTSPALKSETLSAKVTLGTIANLLSDSEEISLQPSSDWKQVETALTPTELRWGSEVSFTLSEQAEKTDFIWIDNVRLTQDLGDPLNLVHNSSFEQRCPNSEWPLDWSRPIEDQWVSWVGDKYRAPLHDTSNAVSGRHSLRSTVTYADVSGISQVIHLAQDRPRLVVIGAWSKLENSIGNRPPGYYGSDNLPNLTVFVHHTDGTMQEVSPTLCLGESDHDWDYRRIGFLPQKPVEKIRLQVTVIGTEPTTSLWIDDVSAFELSGDAVEPLPSEGYAPSRALSCVWGTLDDIDAGKLRAANDNEHLYFSIPTRPGIKETLIYLNTHAEAEFVDHYRYLYDVIRISEDGSFEIGKVAEKQGYIATGKFVSADTAGLSLRKTEKGHLLSVPFRALQLEGIPDRPIGFNVQWNTLNGPVLWTSNVINIAHLGTLIPARSPDITIRSVRFGNRYEYETDQSQDFVTHPPIYAGMNEAELVLANQGKAARVELQAGIRGRQQY
ncbi:MAG: hypothetical protein ABIH23_16220, partial [bacterium]